MVNSQISECILYVHRNHFLMCSAYLLYINSTNCVSFLKWEKQFRQLCYALFMKSMSPILYFYDSRLILKKDLNWVQIKYRMDRQCCLGGNQPGGSQPVGFHPCLVGFHPRWRPTKKRWKPIGWFPSYAWLVFTFRYLLNVIMTFKMT